MKNAFHYGSKDLLLVFIWGGKIQLQGSEQLLLNYFYIFVEIT